MIRKLRQFSFPSYAVFGLKTKMFFTLGFCLMKVIMYMYLGTALYIGPRLMKDLHPALLNISTQEMMKPGQHIKMLAADFFASESFAADTAYCFWCKLCPTQVENLDHLMTQCRVT